MNLEASKIGQGQGQELSSTHVDCLPLRDRFYEINGSP
jgi:hypothetical protein